VQWFEQNLAAVDKQFHTTLDERNEVSIHDYFYEKGQLYIYML
jgi:hypothetical protein